MFSEEELRDIIVLNRGDDYVEVTCGCTSLRHGDAGGKLRVFISGELKITCECYLGCPEDNLTPAAFEKHAGIETCRRWKSNIWIFVDGYKVPLIKTSLLKYYNQYLKPSNRSRKFFHRDEFIKCTKCKKQRRFRRRSKEECRSYHDGLINKLWKCSDGKFSCDNVEERASRRAYKGCSLSSTCGGCASCLCFGCEMCCFSGCNCKTCINFTKA